MGAILLLSLPDNLLNQSCNGKSYMIPEVHYHETPASRSFSQIGRILQTGLTVPIVWPRRVLIRWILITTENDLVADLGSDDSY